MIRFYHGGRGCNSGPFQLNNKSNYSFLLFAFSEFLWILTRQQFPDRHLVDGLYKKIRYLGLDTRRLKVTDQKSCPNPSYSFKREIDGDWNEFDETDEKSDESFFNHEHPFQTSFEPNGPSYWPPA